MKTLPRKVCSREWMLIFLFGIAILFILSGCEVNDEGITEPGIQKCLSNPQHVLNGNNVTRSDDSRPNGFFPLDMGNRWTYTGETSIMAEGGEPLTIHFEEEHKIVGTEELFDRMYILEEQVHVDDYSGDPIVSWARYRQDRSGLYTADVPLTDPPGDDEVFAKSNTARVDKRRERWDILCQRAASGFQSDNLIAFRQASNNLYRKMRMIDEILGRQTPGVPLLGDPPGGVLPDEITRLRYPLHPRQEWIIRDSPLFESMVIRHDVLDLPAGKMNGFRIGVFSELYDPGDEVLLWYGRNGFLRMFAHFEVEMVDPSGNTTGILVSEENMFLTNLELARGGRRIDPAECKHDLMQAQPIKPQKRSGKAGR